MFYGFVYHHRLGRVAEHLRHIQVEGFHTVTLYKREMGIACGLTHYVHRGAFTFGNTTHMFNMFLVDEQAHAFLALVGDDFLGREGLVADRQLRHVNASATLLHQFREAVEVTGRSMVVDADYGIHLFFAEGTHKIIGTFLHLGVGTLYGVELNAVAVSAGING